MDLCHEAEILDRWSRESLRQDDIHIRQSF